MTHAIEIIVALAAGIGLAAASGFRVFLPLLALGLASRTGALPVAQDFAWVGQTPALVVLGVAAVMEVGAYYIPWVDHALDTIATPAAVLAGVLASGALLDGLPPVLRWTLAIVAGGGVAGTVQGTTVLARLKSGALTGGLGNPIVATGEWILALLTATLAVLVPVIALLVVIAGMVFVIRRAGRIAFGRPRARPSEP